MFSDPIVVQSVRTSTTAQVSLARIDTDEGASKYALNHGAGAFSRAAISHQTTKENGPVIPTDRHAVRFDLEKADPATGKPIRAFAQFTLGVPRSQFTMAEAQDVAFRLLNFILGNNPGQFIDSAAYSTLATNIQRLQNGEV